MNVEVVGQTQMAIAFMTPVVTGLLVALIVGFVFRALSDRIAADRVKAARAKADSKRSAARVARVHDAIPWVGWLSEEIIEIPPDADPGVDNTRYPGDDRAIKASEPFEVNGAELVVSRVSFDLIGTHHAPAFVTDIKVVIDERRPVPCGTVYYAVPQGLIPKGVLAFDLGSADLRARAQNDDDSPSAYPYLFKDSVVTLKDGEAIGFRAVVFAPLFGDEIRYHFEVTFESGPPVSVYSSTDEPFQIVGYPKQARRAYFAASTAHRSWPHYPHDPPC
jgi:hypothetical protein